MSKKTVKLFSDMTSVAVNGYTKLTFVFPSVPSGFTLSDIKVVNGVVTSLVQDSNNPLVYNAVFTPGNTKAPMAVIKLTGEYSDQFGKGNPSNALTLKVTDKAVTPTIGFSNNNMTVEEGNSGTKIITYTVSLSEAVSSKVTVGYTTSKLQGTAIAGDDFVAKTGTITFNPGETSKTFTIEVISDTKYEGKEYFYTHLTSPTGGILVANGAEGLRSNWVTTYISNDDVNEVSTVGFLNNSASITEGDSGLKRFDFIATLDKVSTEEVTIEYTTSKLKGSAIAGSDFVEKSGSITFAPGETSKTISIDVVGDMTYEGKENFYVHLTSVTGADLVVNGSEGLRSNWITGYINNDDTFGSVGPDSVYGTPNQDTLGGTSSSDNIDGMGGKDIITGYAGGDTFIFSSAYASSLFEDISIIEDFKKGEDRIGLKDGTLFENLRIEQGVNEYSDNTMIYLNSGDYLVMLSGVNSSELNSSDFWIM